MLLGTKTAGTDGGSEATLPEDTGHRSKGIGENI